MPMKKMSTNHNEKILFFNRCVSMLLYKISASQYQNHFWTMIRMRHLFYFLLLTIIVFFFLKCGHPNSSADFYINNQSDFDLYIALNNKPPGVALVLPYDSFPSNTKIAVFHRIAIGGNHSFTPSETLEWIYLYMEINDSVDLKTVYQQNPIIDDKWDLVEQNSGKGGTSNVWELIIENSDLDLN
jgi:hypothetical protein